MMMGLGFWLMLLVLSVPILLLVGLVLLMIKPIIRPMETPASAGSMQKDPGSSRAVCSHCGAGLQANWAHCPQCGAPANG
jgi:hypothetical protein